ncbi:MAG: YcgN family cysteine cluster protein [Granulosicoccus sp.]|nr:YcgN family cysteine cluster protein [Granulosicoccus sp.]
MSDDTQPFWETLSLDEMSDEQWESLCDGCGRCCLQKLEDEDTGEVWFTRVSCRQLDRRTCRCRDYARRFTEVPDCLSVRPLTEEKSGWLPDTCAYRKLYRGEPLDWWHPLVSGRRESVMEAGISVAGSCVSETGIPVSKYFHYLVHWDKPADN